MSDALIPRSGSCFERMVNFVRDHGESTTKQIMDACGMSSGQHANNRIIRAYQVGWLRRVRRGVYAVGARAGGEEPAGEVAETPLPAAGESLGKVICLARERARLRPRSERVDSVLLTAFRHTQTIGEWSAEQGVAVQEIVRRINDGWSPEGCVTRAMCDRYASVEMWPGANHVRFRHDREATRRVERQGRHTLQEIALFMGMTRERIRQVETVALRKARGEARRLGIEDEWKEALAHACARGGDDE